MFVYRVKSKCFIDGTLRVPGGRHDPYRSAEKLNPCPSALVLVEEKDVPKRKPKTKKDTAPQAPEIQGVKMKGEDVVFKDSDMDVI